MATLATNVSFQCLGLDGKPLAGGKVYTYEAGTTTLKNTYTTHEGDVPNTNPVILDQNGKAKIFLGDGAYRIRIEDKDGALVDDINQISRYVTQSDFAEFQQTVETGINELEQVKDQIDTYVDSSISDQKGYAGGIAPLNENNKVDPVHLPDLPNDAIPQATETVVGVAETATQAEVDAATDDERIVTPLKLLGGVKKHLNASGNAPMFPCRAWIYFDGTTTPPAIKASGNISSITDLGAGRYKLNFLTQMPHANFVALSLTSRDSGSAFASPGLYAQEDQTVSSVTVQTNHGTNYVGLPRIGVAIIC